MIHARFYAIENTGGKKKPQQIIQSAFNCSPPQHRRVGGGEEQLPALQQFSERTSAEATELLSLTSDINLAQSHAVMRLRSAGCVDDRLHKQLTLPLKGNRKEMENGKEVKENKLDRDGSGCHQVDECKAGVGVIGPQAAPPTRHITPPLQ